MTTIEVPPHALEVLNTLEAAGYEAFAVGGCVRDALMGITPQDWDLCTNASPEQSLKIFSRYHCIKTGLKHGTITVMVHHQPIELTTYRMDGAYSDNRHPDEVQFVSDIHEDLSRRDFTINAMAYSPTRGLIDAFGGREDLAAGLIRCVGVASARFHEDGLRILRALRFASRFRFEMDPHTSEAIRDCRALLDNVSEERILKELRGILSGKGAASMLLNYPEVFAQIMPELAPMQDCEQNSPHHIYDVWSHCAHTVQHIKDEDTLRFAALLHDCGKPATLTLDEAGIAHFIGHPDEGAEVAGAMLRRLKSDNATIKAVKLLVRYHDAQFPTSRAGMRRWLGKFGEQGVQHLLLLKRADVAAQSNYHRSEKLALLDAARELFYEVLELSACFTTKDLMFDGRDLMDMGVKPGPAIRDVLETLLAEVQEERLENEFEALKARARQLIIA